MDKSELILYCGFGFFIVLAVIAFIYSQIMDKKRREGWKKISSSTGFKYIEYSNGIFQKFEKLKLFSTGRSRRARNCLIGSKDNVEIIIAEYSYVTGHGKNSQTHIQSVCLLESPDLSLPRCFLRKEIRLFDFLGKLFGGQDINFAEDKNFSDAFVLQGDNEALVRKLFNQRLRNRFVSLKDENIQFEAADRIMVFHLGKRIEPGGFKKLLFDSFALYEALKTSPGNRIN